MAREVRSIFPDSPLYKVGTLSHKDEDRELDKLLQKGGAIVLGTPRALAILPRAVSLVAVVSFDSLLFYPHYAIGERILTLLSSLHDIADSKLYIQTRSAHFSLLTHLSRGSLHEWYREELVMRERFKYPPYTQILELRYPLLNVGTTQEIKEKLTRLFAPTEPHFTELRSERLLVVTARFPSGFYTPESARTHPLHALLVEARKDGAQILWNSPSL